MWLRRLVVSVALFLFLAGCNPNLIDQIVSNPGHCPGEQYGIPCNSK